jgi:DNA-binding FadR family transcriptional regulator
MIECYAIDLFKTSNVRNLPKVDLALERASKLPMPLNTVESVELLNRIRVFLEFHNSLVESSGNSRLNDIYHSISYNLARYQFIYFHIHGTAQHSLGDHKKILEFIKNGAYDQAKEELRRHVDYAVELVKSKISHSAVSSAG